MDAHTLADLLAMPTESIDRPILDIESKRSIICQICDALSYLHSHGLVHRDLRPENILISDDKQYVKLTDFEFAKFSSNRNEMRVTQTGEMIGSASYSSPEQLSGATVDTRSDLFSLGCLIYELLACEPPLKDGIPFAVSPETNPATNSKLSRTLQACVNKLLQKSPDSRYSSADEVKELVAKSRLVVPDTIDKRITKRKQAAVAAACVLVLVSLAIGTIGKITTKTHKQDSLTAQPMTDDKRFYTAVGEMSKAIDGNDPEKVYTLTSQIISLMSTLKPTVDKNKKLHDLVASLKDKQYYDIGYDISEKAADFAIKGGENPQFAFFSTSQAQFLDSTDQFEESIAKSNQFLNSEYAKRYPSELMVLYTKQSKAQAISHLLIDKPDIANSKQLEAEAKSIVAELGALPLEANTPQAILVQQAKENQQSYTVNKNSLVKARDAEFRKQHLAEYIEAVNKRLSSLKENPLAANASAIQKQEESNRQERSIRQIVKDMTRQSRHIEQGQLFNLIRLNRAMDLIAEGRFDEADRLAEAQVQYTLHRPYSKVLNHVLGHLHQAYRGKKKYESAQKYIDSAIQYEEKNPQRDVMDNLTELYRDKGIVYLLAGNPDKAIIACNESLSTNFAKSRLFDKNTLGAKLWLAKALLAKEDKTSKSKGVETLQKLDRDGQDNVDPKDEEAMAVIKEARNELSQYQSNKESK
jgi:serine/threonine protein kinase